MTAEKNLCLAYQRNPGRA